MPAQPSASQRGKEIAVRVALGSGQHRLFAHFFVENVVLAALGAAASVAAAFGLVRGLVAWVPFDLPAATPIRVDGAVLGFALAVATGTALVLTFVPLVVTRRLMSTTRRNQRAGRPEHASHRHTKRPGHC